MAPPPRHTPENVHLGSNGLQQGSTGARGTPKQCSMPCVTLQFCLYFLITSGYGRSGVAATHSLLHFFLILLALVAFFHSYHVHLLVRTPFLHLTVFPLCLWRYNLKAHQPSIL